jgi:predicted enzyme related to lactoylglutathione lyase
MSDLNSVHNRIVWFDLPVADLDRAAAFYRAVLAISVHKEQFDNFSFCVLEHGDGNGGCLVPKPQEVTATAGILVYMNVNGRIRDAVSQVEALGGKVLEPTHAIGPHGFRAIVLDSEGNRIALHSESDR